ncbi:MAG: SLATT domain-containing protein [Candidatus Hadarchaeum sp.]
MEKISAPEESRELIQGWLIHARKGWKKQEEAARRLESQDRRVGVASVILSVIIGASLFASLETMYEPWGRIIAGIVSISASVLASLITFHRYEERTEKHRAAGVRYKVALRKLEKMHTVPDSSMLDQESVNRIEEKLDELEKSAPVVPEDINSAVEERYQVYSFVAKAADLRPGQEDRG